MQQGPEILNHIRGEILKVVMGQDEAVSLLLTALLARGHVLVEGVPGLAKTLLSKTLAHILGVQFNRIQFTPDLMPADVTGTSVFDLENRSFRLRKGPLFTEILLADEINRTPPKTQAALLEAMEERQVSIDGQTIPLSENFMVIATQNPIEQEGTYPLPEAQLDRFLMKIILDYPSREAEWKILARYGAVTGPHDVFHQNITALGDTSRLDNLRASIPGIKIEEGIVRYVQTIIENTRRSPHFYLGVSPRGGIALLRSGQCLAALEGMDFITPDHVKQISLPVLRHRVIMRPEAELEGLTPDRVLSRIIDEIPIPR